MDSKATNVFQDRDVAEPRGKWKRKPTISHHSEETALDVRSVEGLKTLTRAMINLIESLSASRKVRPPRRRRRAACGKMAERIYKERSRRNRFFPGSLFGEPAWDILLDLYMAAAAHELRSIKEACISSHVPDATALRYIEQLVAYKLVQRRPDKTDSRRKFLSLTPEGLEKLSEYLQSMQTIGTEAADIAQGLVTDD